MYTSYWFHKNVNITILSFIVHLNIHSLMNKILIPSTYTLTCIQEKYRTNASWCLSKTKGLERKWVTIWKWKRLRQNDNNKIEIYMYVCMRCMIVNGTPWRWWWRWSVCYTRLKPWVCCTACRSLNLRRSFVL